MKKLLALAGLASALTLPCAALADTTETQCTTIQLAETTVLSCTPIADPEAYYYAGPDTDTTLSAVPVENNDPDADAMANAVSYIAAFSMYGGS